MASSSNTIILPYIPTAPTVPLWPPKASVQDSAEGDDSYDSSSTVGTPTISSRNSVSDFGLEDDVEEVTREVDPVARIDGAMEIARSLFGCVPPKNFGRVMPGVYRSAFPQRENLSFLKTLGLKTILTLVTEDYSEQHNHFVTENSIQHFRIKIAPNKDPFVVISQCDIATALSTVMNKANHPILIHCNKGKHRTGTLVGCLRKVLGWDMSRVAEEYHKYAGIKARVLDERFMDMFDERSLRWIAKHNGLIDNDEPLRGSPITNMVTTRLRG